MKPLADALPSAEPLGEAEVIGRPCRIFRFRDVGAADRQRCVVYHLDRQTSVPIKVEFFHDADRARDQMPIQVWEATTLDEVAGHHVPLKSTLTTYAVRKSPEGRWSSMLDMTQSIRITEIGFDDVTSRGNFWPSLKPGVHVLDSIANRSYDEPGAAKTADATPIRVQEEGWASGPALGVGLSLTVLAVGLGLRWRAQRTAGG